MNLGRRRLENRELCACFEALGFTGVSAFMASGNVMFEVNEGSGPSGPKLESFLASGLEDQLHYPVPTFVRSAEEVGTVAANRPFSDETLAASNGKLQVAFLRSTPTVEATATALALSTSEDRLHLAGRELYWLPQDGLSDSDLNWKALEKALGSMTVRTHRTVTRIVAKLG